MRSLLAPLLIVGSLMLAGPTQALPIPVDPPVTFASEGDSISALRDNNNVVIQWSWVRDAVTDGGLKYIGVYMRAGAATPELRAHAAWTKAQVEVIMAGTNDVSQGISPNVTCQNINFMFARGGAAHKVLSAIAPRNSDHIAQTNALNATLARYAKAEGWTFIDPWASVRMPNGTWRPGTNADRLHPSPATGALVGSIMHQLIITEATR